MAKEYREKVEKELKDICQDVLVSPFLMPDCPLSWELERIGLGMSVIW